MEDDVVVDGIVVVEEAQSTTHSDQRLAYSVLTMASMDTMLHSVLKEPVHQAVVVLLNLCESAIVISLKHRGGQGRGGNRRGGGN